MNPASHGSLRTDTFPYFAGRYFSYKNRIRQDVSSDAAPVLHGIYNSRGIPPDTVRRGLLISRNARDTAGTTPPAACGTSSFRHIPQNTGQCLTGYSRNKRDDTAGSASASVLLPSEHHTAENRIYHPVKRGIAMPVKHPAPHGCQNHRAKNRNAPCLTGYNIPQKTVLPDVPIIPYHTGRCIPWQAGQ